MSASVSPPAHHVISYQGVLSKIIYSNVENSFMIGVVQTEQAEHITFSGYVQPIKLGVELCIYGQWTVHKKFGRQFALTSYVIKMPTSLDGLQRFLASGIIKGIGPQYAQRLIDHFGPDLMQVLHDHPERLAQVPGFGEKRAAAIAQAWQEHAHSLQALMFLQSHGLSPAYASRVFRHYKQKTIAVVQANPYQIARDVWGIGFALADRLARSMGYAADSPYRIQSAIMYVLMGQHATGHVYSMHDDLVQATLVCCRRDDISEDGSTERPVCSQQVINALADLIEQRHIVQLDSPQGRCYGRVQDYDTERTLAHHLMRLASACPVHRVDKQTVLGILEKTHVVLHDMQAQALVMALTNSVSIITGGPGTGKTTITRCLIQVLEDQGIRYRLAAPTGRAAKRLSESTGRQASTIHRLLELDPETFTFTYHQQNCLDVDMIIIDEASMIDQSLAYALMQAISAGTRVLMLGDIDQLPSVGPGNVLADMLSSGCIAHTRLTHIFRQAQNSLITINAHRIISGAPPVAHYPDARNDFIFIPCAQPEQVIDMLAQQIYPLMAQRGITHDQSIVITPMHKGVAGTQVLNQALQQAIQHHEQVQVSVIFGVLKKGDRVMQLRNNYEKSVFNGDMGIITHIDIPLRVITVTFPEQVVVYEEHLWSELMLAYAITVHKSQGSEYDAVIIPLFTHQYTLLSRNLIYTAMTRAKKLCIMIGQSKALYMALGKEQKGGRLTKLHQWLQEIGSAQS